MSAASASWVALSFTGSFLMYKNVGWALAGWLSWLEHRPVHQKVAGSILSQGTHLVVGSVAG